MPAHAPPSDLTPSLSRRLPLWLLLPQLRRGLFIWLLIHTVAWLGLQMLAAPSPTFAVTRPGAVLIVTATSVLALVDARIMRESLFFGSLGVPRWVPAAAGAAAAGVMEIAVSVLW